MIKKLDWVRVTDYVKRGLLSTTKHPKYDIWIVNYTKYVKAERLWDDLTEIARGLVIDKEGYIVARTIPNFFNFEEVESTVIPENETFEITEKMDGSLGLLFFYNDEWIFASRGSFSSDMSKKAVEIFSKKKYYPLDINYTYIYEIIYIENTIVVNYGDTEDCFLITAINNHNGFEPKRSELVKLFPKIPLVNLLDVSKISYRDSSELFMILRDLDLDNKEGFVVRFENGLRIKLKFSNYFKKHYLRTVITDHDIWMNLKEGGDYNELFENVADEHTAWIFDKISMFRSKFNEIERQALLTFYNLVFCNGVINKKELAEYIKNDSNNAIIFRLFDRKQYDYIIWRKIKPETKSNPFLERIQTKK
jgi:hypothetical protein